MDISQTKVMLLVNHGEIHHRHQSGTFGMAATNGYQRGDYMKITGNKHHSKLIMFECGLYSFYFTARIILFLLFCF